MKRSFSLFVMFTVLGLGLVGCQSEADALKMVCDSPNQIENQDASFPERHVSISVYIATNLSNDSVISIFESMETMTPEQFTEAIEDIGERSGLDHCEFVEFHREYDQWKRDVREN